MANEMDLLPPFSDGEMLTIQRAVKVGGKMRNVLIHVLVLPDKSWVNNSRLFVEAQVSSWGESSYADGRVATQAASITRLTNHLQEHCTDPDCPHRNVKA